MTSSRDEQRQKEKRLRNELITICQKWPRKVRVVVPLPSPDEVARNHHLESFRLRRDLTHPGENVELLNCNHSALDLPPLQGKHALVASYKL
jgi:hypothetical protein